MTGHPRLPPIVRAKLAPAVVPEGLIVRDRVLAQLSADRRFTLVSAMPGYGKTAAVRHWIDTVDVPVAWLSVDLLDQAPVSFWSHLLVALGATLPGMDEASMLLWERGADDPLFLGALVAQLEALDRPTVLVLDGLTDRLGREVLDGLALLVERAGDTLRMVVTARSDPALPTARWQGLGWMSVIREDTLRLTDDEALEIAEHTDTAIRHPDEVVALNRRVDRWPIGFHMALLSRPAGSAPREALSPSIGSDPRLAGYLVAEVLDAMSEEERNVALGLCVLEQFDPDLCRRLLGPDAEAALRQLLRRGMFLSVVDQRTGTMRFHDLFRELLQTELGHRDPAAWLELNRRAAMLWRERGDLLSAYHHLAAIGETGSARRLLVDPTLELVDRGDLDELRQLARQLPTQHQVADPNLAIDLALVALYADGTLAASRWCDRADQLMETGDDELELRLLGLRCTIALLDADLDSAVSVIAAHRLPPTGSVDAFEQRLPIIAARVMLAARRQDEADEWITLAERIDAPEIVTEVTVPTLRAWHHWLFGSLRRAVTLIDGALAWIDEHHIRRHHLAFDTLISGGWCRLSTGDVADATRLAERAWADAEAIGCAWNQLQAGHLVAWLALVTGEPRRALRVVEGLRGAIPFDSCQTYSDRLLGLEVEALAASGKTREAISRMAELDPGPRAFLLEARLRAPSDREVERLLADRGAWPVIERLKAELVVHTRRPGSGPSPKLIELVATAADEGWVQPFLGMGPKVERLLREIPLHTVHPQLGRTLDYLAPDLPGEARGGSGIRLTSRELSLVELLPTHLSYAEIGERLYLSVNTVKSNLKALYRKLDATTRAEAVEAARGLGLI